MVYVDYDPVAISHGAADLLGQETMQGTDDSLNGRIQQQLTWRSREQVVRDRQRGRQQPARALGGHQGAGRRRA